MNNKTVYVSLIVIALLAVGAYFYPTSKFITGAVSPSGTYNNDQGLSQITFNPATATSTSILNNGASDRAVIASYGFCSSIGTSTTPFTGTGLASWTLKSATTSVQGFGLAGNTNTIFNVTIATTSNTAAANATGNGIVYASSTGATTVPINYIWPVNTYMTFDFNATNTASCSLSVTWNPL